MDTDVVVVVLVFVVGVVFVLTMVVPLVSTELREVATPQGRVPE